MAIPLSPRVYLVAHDFSAGAHGAASLALADLQDSKRGGRLVLLHVFSVMSVPHTPEGAAFTKGLTDLESAATIDATRQLERVAEQLRKQSAGAFEIEVSVRVGPTAETIVSEAESRDAERIYVGTQGKTGVSHFLLGSVAERVVRSAPVHVVVAHAAGAPAALPPETP